MSYIIFNIVINAIVSLLLKCRNLGVKSMLCLPVSANQFVKVSLCSKLKLCFLTKGHRRRDVCECEALSGQWLMLMSVSELSFSTLIV